MADLFIQCCLKTYEMKKRWKFISEKKFQKSLTFSPNKLWQKNLSFATLTFASTEHLHWWVHIKTLAITNRSTCYTKESFSPWDIYNVHSFTFSSFQISNPTSHKPSLKFGTIPYSYTQMTLQKYFPEMYSYMKKYNKYNNTASAVKAVKDG